MPLGKVAQIAELWRYPVKSMRGESCSRLSVDTSGVAEDRRFAITSSRAPIGKPLLSSDERALMLLYQPRVRTDGSVRVVTPDGQDLDLHDPTLLRSFQASLHIPARFELLRSTRALTDVRPIALHSVQTANALAEAQKTDGQVDGRRLRSNIILDLVNGRAFGEDALAGHVLRIGDKVQILSLERIPRCRIVSLHPETAEWNREFLTYLAHNHQSRAGMYGRVITPGTIEVGDPVHLAPAT